MAAAKDDEAGDLLSCSVVADEDAVGEVFFGIAIGAVVCVIDADVDSKTKLLLLCNDVACCKCISVLMNVLQNFR